MFSASRAVLFYQTIKAIATPSRLVAASGVIGECEFAGERGMDLILPDKYLTCHARLFMTCNLTIKGVGTDVTGGETVSRTDAGIGN